MISIVSEILKWISLCSLATICIFAVLISLLSHINIKYTLYDKLFNLYLHICYILCCVLSLCLLFWGAISFVNWIQGIL